MVDVAVGGLVNVAVEFCVVVLDGVAVGVGVLLGVGVRVGLLLGDGVRVGLLGVEYAAVCVGAGVALGGTDGLLVERGSGIDPWTEVGSTGAVSVSGGGSCPPGTVDGVAVADARDWVTGGVGDPVWVGPDNAAKVAATAVATCPGNVSVPDAGALAVASALTVAPKSGSASATRVGRSPAWATSSFALIPSP